MSINNIAHYLLLLDFSSSLEAASEFDLVSSVLGCLVNISSSPLVLMVNIGDINAGQYKVLEAS